MHFFYESEFAVHAKCSWCGTVSRVWKEQSKIYKCPFCKHSFQTEKSWPVVEFSEWVTRNAAHDRTMEETINSIRKSLETVETCDPVL